MVLSRWFLINNSSNPTHTVWLRKVVLGVMVVWIDIRDAREKVERGWRNEESITMERRCTIMGPSTSSLKS